MNHICSHLIKVHFWIFWKQHLRISDKHGLETWVDSWCINQNIFGNRFTGKDWTFHSFGRRQSALRVSVNKALDLVPSVPWRMLEVDYDSDHRYTLDGPSQGPMHTLTLRWRTCKNPHNPSKIYCILCNTVQSVTAANRGPTEHSHVETIHLNQSFWLGRDVEKQHEHRENELNSSSGSHQEL